jgi:hypothetical protein
MFGFKLEEFFEAEEEARAEVRVDFSREEPAAPAAPAADATTDPGQPPSQ